MQRLTEQEKVRIAELSAAARRRRPRRPVRVLAGVRAPQQRRGGAGRRLDRPCATAPRRPQDRLCRAGLPPLRRRPAQHVHRQRRGCLHLLQRGGRHRRPLSRGPARRSRRLKPVAAPVAKPRLPQSRDPPRWAVVPASGFIGPPRRRGLKTWCGVGRRGGVLASPGWTSCNCWSPTAATRRGRPLRSFHPSQGRPRHPPRRGWSRAANVESASPPRGPTLGSALLGVASVITANPTGRARNERRVDRIGVQPLADGPVGGSEGVDQHERGARPPSS